MNKEQFFTRLEVWSERKHRILGKYLHPFIAKVASSTSRREIFVVDGFAGAAKYDDGKEGSPLIIAKLSDKCATWQNPANLRMINVEADKEMFASLEETTKPWTEKGLVTNVRSEFHKAIPQILKQVGQIPALLFIDPFGPTGIYFANLLPILQRDQPVTEIVLNFDTDGLRRIADTTRTSSTDPIVQKAIYTNIANVTKILGSDSWREPYKNTHLTTDEREELLLSIYLSNLAKFNYYVVAYGIKEALGKSNKYHLIYCTRHQHGVLLMNDFLFEEDNSMLEDHYLKEYPLFQDSNDEETIRRDKIKVMLAEYLSANKNITRGQFRRDLIFNNFAQFHSKDYNAAIKEFLETGKLVASHGKHRINDDEPLRHLGE